MRFNGHNILAIIIAAAVFYGLEYLIYAVLIPAPTYAQLSGMSAGQAEMGMSRMALGPIMPLLATIGLSFAIKWRNAAGWIGGVVTGLIMAVCFAIGTELYHYVYNAGDINFTALNSGHYLICYCVAGAILGVWK